MSLLLSPFTAATGLWLASLNSLTHQSMRARKSLNMALRKRHTGTMKLLKVSLWTGSVHSSSSESASNM